MSLSDVEFNPRYLALLQDMEAKVVHLYRESPELTDFQVDKAFNGLIRLYQAEQRGKSAPVLKFGEIDQQIYDAVKIVCEVSLGRIPDEGAAEAAGDALTVDEVIACLKRIRESIDLWTKEFGRVGYLRYITQFL